MELVVILGFPDRLRHYNLIKNLEYANYSTQESLIFVSEKSMSYTFWILGDCKKMLRESISSNSDYLKLISLNFSINYNISMISKNLR
jgi:hypothetical protein